MRSFSIVNYYRKIHKNVHLRCYCSSAEAKNKTNIDNIRNIGILAHIDAGQNLSALLTITYNLEIMVMIE